MFFDEWRGADRERVTVRDLLEHASGLAARLIDVPPESRREFEHDICRMPLEYAPRTQAIYSDLDFILLGFLAADRGGASAARSCSTRSGPAEAGHVDDRHTDRSQRRPAWTVDVA